MQSQYINAIKKVKAKEYRCKTDSFSKEENVFIVNNDIVFKMISFGANTVVNTNEKLLEEIKSLLSSEEGPFCFDAPMLGKLDRLLHSNGTAIGEIYDYFFPKNVEELHISYNGNLEIKRLDFDDIRQIANTNKFDNALCSGDSISLNMFAYAAFEKGNIVSIAGTSSNSEKLWAVGVDTLKEYRNQGLATFLVSKVSKEVLSLGKIPLYPTWYSNIGSRSTAINTGFFPGFVEIGAE